MLALLLAWAIPLGSGRAAAEAEPEPEPEGSRIEACRRAVEARGPSRRTTTCFSDAARQEGRWDEVQAELRAHVEQPGSSPYWKLALASVVATQGELARAVELLDEAMATLPEPTTHDRAYVLMNRGQYLRVLDRYDEAEASYREAAALGQREDAPEVELAALMELAVLMMRRGGDLSEARAILDRVVPEALATDNPWLGSKALINRATLSIEEGRTAQARRDYELLRTRARAQGDAFDEAFAATGLVDLEVERLDLRGGREMPPELRASLDDAWRAVRASRVQHSVAFLACLEGELRAAMGRAREAAAQYERCAEIHRQLEGRRGELRARTWQAIQLVIAGEIDAAAALMPQVSAAMADLGLRWEYAGYAQVFVALARGELPEALEHAHRLFEQVELYRGSQSDEADRRRGLSQLSLGYYLLSGMLLRDHADTPGMLDEAFLTIERMRARELLDALRRADAMRPDPDDPTERRWQAVVDEIAALQRALLEDTPDTPAYRASLEELSRLEAHERRLRGTLGAGSGELGSLLAPRFPALSEVQAALDEREAILSYQLADVHGRLGIPEGGSWLWVVTRDAVEAVPLPERRVLEPRLAFIGGVIARRDGREAEAMARLHHELLEPALARLPETVDRLVIVPDGALWSLPFEALVPKPGGSPLVARFSLSLVPSVTSWMRWGTDPPERAPGLLALAQPGLDQGGAVAEFRRGTLASGLELGALPRAVDEVEAITRIWEAGRSEIEVGAEASERFLKQLDLSDYGLLHFATHAVMDPDHPDRSAVVLAAGGEGEDGLLQAREIVRLPLSGKVVVLSACSGAAGTFVRGEGVMSLARAFLQGGARAVVASRWPLADADAMALFERLYLHIDEGRSLSEALAEAQRDLVDAGAPTAAWAGVVVLGRGDVVLVPRPAWWRWRRGLLGLGAGLALLGGAGLAWRGRRRRSRARLA